MSTDIDSISKVIRFSDNDPLGFTTWADGVNIEDVQVNKWIKECIQSIQQQILTEENTVNPSAFSASGNSIVTCIAYRKDNDEYELTVVVARNYFSAVVEDFNPKKDYEFIKVK